MHISIIWLMAAWGKPRIRDFSSWQCSGDKKVKIIQINTIGISRMPTQTFPLLFYRDGRGIECSGQEGSSTAMKLPLRVITDILKWGKELRAKINSGPIIGEWILGCLLHEDIFVVLLERLSCLNSLSYFKGIYLSYLGFYDHKYKTHGNTSNSWFSRNLWRVIVSRLPICWTESLISGEMHGMGLLHFSFFSLAGK